MRELVALSILALACWWMSGLQPDDATASLDAVPGLGVGPAEALEGDLARLLPLSRRNTAGGGSLWSGLHVESATSFLAWGTPDDLRRIELTVACYRGGVLGRPDRAQIDSSRRRVASLLANVGAAGAVKWASTVIGEFVHGDETARGTVVDGIRVRIGFEARFDLVIVRIDRVPEA